MAEKLFRVRVSTSIDQDIIGFLEFVPPTRRSELLRHIIRYYVSQLREDGELFILSEAPQDPHIPSNYQYISNENKTKEYKIRLDETIDRHLVETIERIPRKRRSEFWRHVLRFYMSYLEDGEIFIMPSEVYTSTIEEDKLISITKEPEKREAPGKELSAFDLTF